MNRNETGAAVNVPEKKQKITYVLLLAGAMLLYILFVCLNEEFSSNIIYAGTMLSEITDFLYLGIEILAFYIAYGYAIYILFAGGFRSGLHYAGIYAIIAGVRYIVLFLLNWLAFGLKVEDMLFQALISFGGLLLEMAQYAAMFMIACLLIRRYNRIYEVMAEGAVHLSQQPVERNRLIFPYRKVALKNDPLRFSAFLIALVLGGVRVISRIAYDLMIGAPGGMGDLLWMIAYYAMDIAVGVAAYFTMLYIVRRLTLFNEAKE